MLGQVGKDTQDNLGEQDTHGDQICRAHAIHCDNQLKHPVPVK